MSPGLGTFGLNAVEAADDGLPLVVSTAPPIVLVGTQNGRILRRDAGGSWSVVYTVSGTPTNQQINSLLASPANPLDVWGFIVHLPISDSDPFTNLHSTDGGLTWTELVFTPDGTQAGRYPPINGGGTAWQAVRAENGAILASDILSPSTYFKHSTDLGQTWTVFATVANDTLNGLTNLYIGGKVWFSRRNTGSVPNDLVGVPYSNPGLVVVPDPHPPYMGYPTGKPYAPLAIVYGLDPSLSTPVLSTVDLSDPSSPVFLGSGPPSGGGQSPVWHFSLSATEAVIGWIGSGSIPKGIWRTADKGATWTLVYSDATAAVISNHERRPALASSGNDLWMVGKGGTSNVLYSTDRGATWAIETIPISYGGGNLTTIAMVLQTFPGLAHYTAVGAAATVGPPLP